MFIGGIAENFEGSYRIGGGREFVIEGDEYDSAFFDKTAKFLKYLPDIAVVNNIEFDHADIYPDLDAIRLAFRRFVNLVPRRGLLLLGADNAEALALARAGALQSRDVRPLRRRRLAGTRPAHQRDVHGIQRATPRDARRQLRGAAARRVQRAECAGGDRGRRRGRAEPEHHGRGPQAVPRRSPAAGASRHGRRRVGLRRLRASSDSDCRDACGSAIGVSTPPLWAIFEPRSATSCRRVFQDDFAKALGAADHVILPPVFRSTLPEDERLSGEQVIADLKRNGVDARYLPSVDEIVRAVARDSRSGDLVVVMSNGGFDNIHQKLLASLTARASR